MKRYKVILIGDWLHCNCRRFLQIDRLHSLTDSSDSALNSTATLCPCLREVMAKKMLSSTVAIQQNCRFTQFHVSLTTMTYC